VSIFTDATCFDLVFTLMEAVGKTSAATITVAAKYVAKWDIRYKML
jgi:hypothetical protein